MHTHLITGGYPAGSSAGHDMTWVRQELLDIIGAAATGAVSVADDYGNLGEHLAEAGLLVTYVAGPVPAGSQLDVLTAWLERGGRWLALHGTSGGRAARIEGSRQRRMVREAHHDVLGCFFLNHPPLRRFEVSVRGGHPLTAGLPDTFVTDDELYLVEPIGAYTPLLTTELVRDPSPPGFGFLYDADTSLLADGCTRLLGYVRQAGAGEVAYIALGHCHDPASNGQPVVDESIAAGGAAPATFRGSWEQPAFRRLLDNAISWAHDARTGGAERNPAAT